MSFFENTRKPVGLGGKIMVAMMNLGHSAMAEWGLSFLQPAPDAMVLDCGCGGGANIKTLLKLCPKGTVQDMPQSYEIATPEALCAFSKAQFRYWAQDEFAALFRRMLTIEQYRNEQMAALYQQYLAGGPLGYVRDLLAAMGFADAGNEAVACYAPLLALLGVYDGAADRQAVLQAVDAFYDDWLDRVRKEGRT